MGGLMKKWKKWLYRVYYYFKWKIDSPPYHHEKPYRPTHYHERLSCSCGTEVIVHTGEMVDVCPNCGRTSSERKRRVVRWNTLSECWEEPSYDKEETEVPTNCLPHPMKRHAKSE